MELTELYSGLPSHGEQPLLSTMNMAKNEFSLPTRVSNADINSIKEAALIIGSGGLVAFPTETVYGLGADATNSTAVAKLYAAKGRPSFNPLISHVADQELAEKLGIFNVDARKLAETIWPGPLTIVVPKTTHCTVCDLALSGLQTIALRIPSHGVARDLIKASQRPIVAPSANLSGRVSPTQSEHVFNDLLGRIDLILDGGNAEIGVESTIISCLDDEVRLLRPGGIATSVLEATLGKSILYNSRNTVLHGKLMAPGMLDSHYAPNALVRLNAETVLDGESLLSFGKIETKNAQNARRILNLSPSSDLIEAAANLFQYLRILDKDGISMIAVNPIPNVDLGEAINDRLQRAASPR